MDKRRDIDRREVTLKILTIRRKEMYDHNHHRI